MDDVLKIIGGAVAAAIGGFIAWLGNRSTQRVVHERQRDADRRAKLLEAYAEWASLIDRQYIRLRFAAMQGDGGSLSEEERKDKLPELLRMWEEVRDADVGVKRASYRIILMEPSADRRESVRSITGQVTFWSAGYKTWLEFAERVCQAAGELQPTFETDLRALVDALANDASLR